MYRKILVPLDGSELSECSLWHVKAIATGCNVPEVILFNSIEPLSSLTLAAVAEEGGSLLATELADRRSEVEDYLTKVQGKMRSEGINTGTVVVDGRPAEAILEYVKKNQVDMIVMSTHGRSGVSRWVMGSVADRVSSHSPVPVLLVAAPGCRVD